MDTEINFVEFIVDQIQDAGEVSFKKMFGEYALYCDEKVVALICEERLFVKPTEAGRTFIEEIVEAPPYPGAKKYFLIEDNIENREWMSELIRLTAAELPKPKTKTRRK